MIIKDLEKKYGKALMRKIIKGNYLRGCTIAINKDGSEDIPEEDIIGAISDMKSIEHDWD